MNVGPSSDLLAQVRMAPRHRTASAIIPAGPKGVNPRRPRHVHSYPGRAHVFEIAIGTLLLAVWGVLQFTVQPMTGAFHVLLLAGALLLIRGVALRPARPD